MGEIGARQTELLRDCIVRARRAKHPNDELVLIGSGTGINPRTAKSLVDLGLLEYGYKSAGQKKKVYVRLPHDTIGELE